MRPKGKQQREGQDGAVKLNEAKEDEPENEFDPRSHIPAALEAQDRGGLRLPTRSFFYWCTPVSVYIVTKVQSFGQIDIPYETFPAKLLEQVMEQENFKSTFFQLFTDLWAQQKEDNKDHADKKTIWRIWRLT